MIYLAGGCPIFGDLGNAIILKDIATNEIFFACDDCGVAWRENFVHDDWDGYEGVRSPIEVAPNGFSLATLSDIAAAGLVESITGELPDDYLIFNREEGFIPPYRNTQQYDGKTIALQLTTIAAQGEKERGVLVGKARSQNDKLFIDLTFVSQIDLTSVPRQFEVKREWLQHIMPMYSAMRPPYSEAELLLGLSLNELPQEAQPDELMNWAKENYENKRPRD